MIASRLRPYATHVAGEMSALATRIGAINLGQGFPDEDGPPVMLQAAQQAIADGLNQYAPLLGIASLREAIAADRERKYGVSYDPESEVMVTVGATEAIAAIALGLLEPGSEVLAIEPIYDAYPAVASMAGVRLTTAPLVVDGRGFALDLDTLRRAVTRQTAAIIVNSPHNPTGAVLSRDELAAIAEIAVERDILVITDEVYECLTYDSVQHVPLAALPGMRDRTLTVSSASKMFNCTGWRTGWVCGNAKLIAAVRSAKQFLSYVGAAVFQPAVALALNTQQAWVEQSRLSLQSRRDRLATGLDKIGFDVCHSSGTYFLCVDPTPLGFTDSRSFCAEVPHRAGVAAIPLSAFCIAEGDQFMAWNHLVRVTFCKREDTLDEALRRLAVLTGWPTAHGSGGCRQNPSFNRADFKTHLHASGRSVIPARHNSYGAYAVKSGSTRSSCTAAGLAIFAAVLAQRALQPMLCADPPRYARPSARRRAFSIWFIFGLPETTLSDSVFRQVRRSGGYRGTCGICR